MSNVNKQAYEKLIAEDIVALNKAMEPASLERKHIEHVLRWSIDVLYGRKYREHFCIYDAKPKADSFELGAKWTCPRCGQQWERINEPKPDGRVATWSKVII